jgi:hypothetical protein
MKKYQVIGGQYEQHWYGESDSFHGAKVIAGKNKEYWDNWQGWHTPSIYLAEDCTEIEAHGRVTVPDGQMVITHSQEARPVTLEGREIDDD